MKRASGAPFENRFDAGVFLFVGGTWGMGLFAAYMDYGFIFKMKMTEVSNPVHRKQKRLRMSSNSFDLKNIAALCET